MNIAFNAIYFGEKAGGAKHLMNLLHNLQKIDKVNNYFIFTNSNMFDFLKTYQRNFHKLIPSVIVNRPLTAILWRQTLLLLKLKSLKIDLYVDMFNPFIFLHSTKSIAIVRDLGECYLRNKYDYFRMFYRTNLMLPLTAKYADKIVAISNSTKKDIIRFCGTNPNKIKVIYHGRDENFYRRDYKGSFARLNGKYSLPKGKYLLHVGRLDPIGKNLLNLIKAFKILKVRKGIEHKLLLIGARWRCSRLIYELVENLNLRSEVIFIGYVNREDLPYFYSISDVLVFPSLFEGFGHPIIEAMSCECPVACSNISALPEIAGESALFFDPYVIDDIAEKVYLLLTDDSLRQEFILKGKENIKRFSWEKNAQEYLKLFKEVANE